MKPIFIKNPEYIPLKKKLSNSNSFSRLNTNFEKYTILIFQSTSQFLDLIIKNTARMMARHLFKENINSDSINFFYSFFLKESRSVRSCKWQFRPRYHFQFYTRDSMKSQHHRQPLYIYNQRINRFQWYERCLERDVDISVISNLSERTDVGSSRILSSMLFDTHIFMFCRLNMSCSFQKTLNHF